MVGGMSPSQFPTLEIQRMWLVPFELQCCHISRCCEFSKAQLMRFPHLQICLYPLCTEHPKEKGRAVGDDRFACYLNKSDPFLFNHCYFQGLCRVIVKQLENQRHTLMPLKKKFLCSVKSATCIFAIKANFGSISARSTGPSPTRRCSTASQQLKSHRNSPRLVEDMDSAENENHTRERKKGPRGLEGKRQEVSKGCLQRFLGEGSKTFCQAVECL